MTRGRAYALRLIVTARWTGNSPFGKLELNELDPFTVTAARALLTASLPLVTAAYVRPLPDSRLACRIASTLPWSNLRSPPMRPGSPGSPPGCAYA